MAHCLRITRGAFSDCRFPQAPFTYIHIQGSDSTIRNRNLYIFFKALQESLVHQSSWIGGTIGLLLYSFNKPQDSQVQNLTSHDARSLVLTKNPLLKFYSMLKFSQLTSQDSHHSL